MTTGDRVMSWSANCPHCMYMAVRSWTASLLTWMTLLTSLALGSSAPRQSRERGAFMAAHRNLGVRGDGVAQVVDHRTRDPKIRGSNPSRSTRKSFPESKCCADSLSVCPTPVCLRTHKNDHVRTLKIPQSMSRVWWITGNTNTLHTGYTFLKTWVAPYYDCSLSPEKAARISRAFHWDKKVV